MVNSWYSWNQKFHHRTTPKPTMTSAFVNLVSFNRNNWTEWRMKSFFVNRRKIVSFLEFSTLGIENISNALLIALATLFSVSVASPVHNRFSS